MMMKEFTERTGVTPTHWEYEQIEELYYNFQGNKDEFCKDWLANGGPEKMYAYRAARIEELESLLVDQAKDYEAAITRQEDEIEKLKAQLDREMEWKPTDSAGTNMEQARYEQLRKSGRVETDEMAKKLVNEFFGFEPDSVEIIHTVHTYEVNKHHQLRKKNEYDRLPCYDATDWNYIRFNCKCWQYEMINGELVPYCS